MSTFNFKMMENKPQIGFTELQRAVILGNYKLTYCILEEDAFWSKNHFKKGKKILALMEKYNSESVYICALLTEEFLKKLGNGKAQSPENRL